MAAYKKSNPLTMMAAIERETAKAICLNWGDGLTAWVPKSVITFDQVTKNGKFHVITVKAWFKNKMVNNEQLPEDVFLPRDIVAEHMF